MYFYYNTVQKTMAETFLKAENFCFMHETFNLREKKIPGRGCPKSMGQPQLF